MTATGRLRPSPSAAHVAALAELVTSLVFVDIVVPRTQIKGKMRLVNRQEALSIVVDTRAAMAAVNLPTDPSALVSPGVMEEWNCEIAIRHLAIAVRDPAEPAKQLADLAEWKLCDDDQISALWQQYRELRDRLDPLWRLDELGEVERAEIRDAVKKKDTDLLRSYGSRKLVSYLLSTADPPPS